MSELPITSDFVRSRERPSRAAPTQRGTHPAGGSPPGADDFKSMFVATVRGLESIDDQIAPLRDQKSEIRKEAKRNGIDRKVVDQIVADRSKAPGAKAKSDANSDYYHSLLGDLARAHVETPAEFAGETDFSTDGIGDDLARSGLDSASHAVTPREGRSSAARIRKGGSPDPAASSLDGESLKASLVAAVGALEAINAQIEALQRQKSQIRKEAKRNGVDLKVLSRVLDDRRKDPAAQAASDATYRLYCSLLGDLRRAHIETAEEFDAEAVVAANDDRDPGFDPAVAGGTSATVREQVVDPSATHSVPATSVTAGLEPAPFDLAPARGAQELGAEAEFDAGTDLSTDGARDDDDGAQAGLGSAFVAVEDPVVASGCESGIPAPENAKLIDYATEPEPYGHEIQDGYHHPKFGVGESINLSYEVVGTQSFLPPDQSPDQQNALGDDRINGTDHSSLVAEQPVPHPSVPGPKPDRTKVNPNCLDPQECGITGSHDYFCERCKVRLAMRQCSEGSS